MIPDSRLKIILEQWETDLTNNQWQSDLTTERNTSARNYKKWSTNSWLHMTQLNGVEERKNRMLIEFVKSMLFEAELDKRFWREAVLNVLCL